MSDFIELEDYDSTLHAEILDALARNDEAVIEQCENDAIAEMKGYLSGRYDTNAIFARRGSERNSLILMYAKDITVYHLFCIHNPYKISAVRQDRYDRAMEWLKQVAAGKISIADADQLPEDDQRRNSNFYIHSNPMHDPHY